MVHGRRVQENFQGPGAALPSFAVMGLGARRPGALDFIQRRVNLHWLPPIHCKRGIFMRIYGSYIVIMSCVLVNMLASGQQVGEEWRRSRAAGNVTNVVSAAEPDRTGVLPVGDDSEQPKPGLTQATDSLLSPNRHTWVEII